MIKFIKNNWQALLMVAFVIISEVIIKLFPNEHHSVYTWGMMLYYFFAKVGYISFIPSIFLYQKEKNIDSKGIYLGLVIWNVLEVLQEINGLLKLNIQFLIKTQSTQSDILQIILIIFVVTLTYIGFKKCCT